MPVFARLGTDTVLGTGTVLGTDTVLGTGTTGAAGGCTSVISSPNTTDEANAGVAAVPADSCVQT